MHAVIIGLGSIGRRHARNVSALRPDARLTFVRRGGEVDDLARELGATVRASIDEVDTPVDLAVLATPSANHIDTLPRLIDRAWPLIVEKPVVSRAADCDRLELALRSAPPAPRVAGFNLRYLASLRRLKLELDAGTLGRVTHASLSAGQWLPDWRPGADFRTGYSADAIRGGGVELDLSHEFDMARWLFGDMRVEAAVAGRLSELDLASNDTALSLLRPVDAAAPIVNVTLDYVSRRPVRRYAVVGDRGTLTWDLSGSLVHSTHDGHRAIDLGTDGFDVAGTYRTMLAAFLGAVEKGEDVRLQSLGDGIASTRLAIAVRELGSHR